MLFLDAFLKYFKIRFCLLISSCLTLILLYSCVFIYSLKIRYFFFISHVISPDMPGPLELVEALEHGGCPTAGCKGVGHIKRARHIGHHRYVVLFLQLSDGCTWWVFDHCSQENRSKLEKARKSCKPKYAVISVAMVSVLKKTSATWNFISPGCAKIRFVDHHFWSRSGGSVTFVSVRIAQLAAQSAKGTDMSKAKTFEPVGVH